LTFSKYAYLCGVEQFEEKLEYKQHKNLKYNGLEYYNLGCDWCLVFMGDREQHQISQGA
jgi:hypothetical protein